MPPSGCRADGRGTLPMTDAPATSDASDASDTIDAAHPTDRPAALRLARLHLRTGGFALARAELETLAGAGALDDEALLDLAEIRWRTGDLPGAGEAAAAYLSTGREALVALVIASEATASLARPTEARRLAARALELAEAPLDSLFAGMTRSAVWPEESTERSTPLAHVAGSPPGAAAGSPAVAAGNAVGAEWATQRDAAGFDARLADDAAPGSGASVPTPDPAAELAAARSALAAGDRVGAAIRLAVVLRFAPALAPAVLHVAAAESGPAYDLVRGDALRLVGHESEARRAYASAAARLTPDTDTDPDMGTNTDRAAVDPTTQETS